MALNNKKMALNNKKASATTCCAKYRKISKEIDTLQHSLMTKRNCMLGFYVCMNDVEINEKVLGFTAQIHNHAEHNIVLKDVIGKIGDVSYGSHKTWHQHADAIVCHIIDRVNTVIGEKHVNIKITKTHNQHDTTPKINMEISAQSEIAKAMVEDLLLFNNVIVITGNTIAIKVLFNDGEELAFFDIENQYLNASCEQSPPNFSLDDTQSSKTMSKEKVA